MPVKSRIYIAAGFVCPCGGLPKEYDATDRRGVGGAKLNGDVEFKESGGCEMKDMVEKPSRVGAKSNLAIFGLKSE